ncbi:hypothetical protein C1645_818239, partial [Glomus cerebriforme]
MSLNKDQFKNLMAQMTRSFEQSTRSILDTFKNTGEDEEFSSTQWIQQFMAAAQANNWSKNRYISIAGGYLKDSAFDWYIENEESFEDWRNPDNFYEFNTIQQKPHEKVDTYTHRFRNLLIKFDPDVKLPEEYQIRIYINGLRKGLAKAVAMEGPDNMKDVIDAARRAETGDYYGVDLNNKPSTPVIQGHFAKECLAEIPLQISQNTNQNINYIHVEDLEQPVEQEAYVVGTRSRPKTTTTLSERTQTMQSESQKEHFLRQNANRNMDVSMKNATPPKPKTKRGPSVIEQLPPYNIADDILTQKANVTLGQMLQLPKQCRNFAEIIRRPAIQPTETNYIDSSNYTQTQNSPSAAKCYIRIKNNPLIAVLDSGLKVQAPSQAMVVTANGHRSRAIGKVTDLGIAISSMLIPTTVQ